MKQLHYTGQYNAALHRTVQCCTSIQNRYQHHYIQNMTAVSTPTLCIKWVCRGGPLEAGVVKDCNTVLSLLKLLGMFFQHLLWGGSHDHWIATVIFVTLFQVGRDLDKGQGSNLVLFHHLLSFFIFMFDSEKQK